MSARQNVAMHAAAALSVRTAVLENTRRFTALTSGNLQAQSHTAMNLPRNKNRRVGAVPRNLQQSLARFIRVGACKSL